MVSILTGFRCIVWVRAGRGAIIGGVSYLDRPSLAERVGAGPEGERPAQQHVWVAHDGHQLPGVLTAWVRTEAGGWAGRVLWAPSGPDSAQETLIGPALLSPLRS